MNARSLPIWYCCTPGRHLGDIFSNKPSPLLPNFPTSGKAFGFSTLLSPHTMHDQMHLLSEMLGKYSPAMPGPTAHLPKLSKLGRSQQCISSCPRSKRMLAARGDLSSNTIIMNILIWNYIGLTLICISLLRINLCVLWPLDGVNTTFNSLINVIKIEALFTYYWDY